MKLGQEVYIIREKSTKQTCKCCEGEKTNEVDGIKWLCPQCEGKGGHYRPSLIIEKGNIVRLMTLEFYNDTDMEEIDNIQPANEIRILTDDGRVIESFLCICENEKEAKEQLKTI